MSIKGVEIIEVCGKAYYWDKLVEKYGLGAVIAMLESDKARAAASEVKPVQDGIMTECLRQQQRDIAAFHSSTGNTEERKASGLTCMICGTRRICNNCQYAGDYHDAMAVAFPSTPLSEEKAVEVMAKAIMDYEHNILTEGHPTQQFDKDTDTGFMAYARVAYRALKEAENAK